MIGIPLENSVAVGDFENDFAPVFTRNDNKITEYSIDREFRLYKNGEPLYADQKGAEGVKIHQNIFSLLPFVLLPHL